MVAIQGRVLGSYREQRVLCMRVADAAQRANDILKLVPVVQLRRKRVPRLEEAFRMAKSRRLRNSSSDCCAASRPSEGKMLNSLRYLLFGRRRCGVVMESANIC
jgi:hypothetical protein